MGGGGQQRLKRLPCSLSFLYPGARPHRMASLLSVLAILATVAVVTEPVDSVSGPVIDFCQPLYERSGPANLFVDFTPGWLNTTWEQLRNVCLSLDVRNCDIQCLRLIPYHFSSNASDRELSDAFAVSLFLCSRNGQSLKL